MGHYISTTDAQRQQMLEAVCAKSMEDFYKSAPADLMLKGGPDIPAGKAELDVSRMFGAMASKNKVFGSIFRGAGAYNHYIPAIVKSVVSKETFVTTYTPYQAEISQGVLQSIFEYQTMICQLTGMDVSNASVYDGATAAAEAVAMCKDRKRSKALVSAAAHPDVIETVRTYCWASGSELELIPEKDGLTDAKALERMLDDSIASVYIAQPNYHGLIEDAEAIGQIVGGCKAKYIMGINPIAAAILKTPAECGADIAVGEGQPLGLPLSFGGPYLGFMAARKAMTRNLPGRIVGETTDDKGRRAYVLTLQGREQHIRREKASSNICSNQALCAMTASVYMAAMGPRGMRQAAEQCYSKAHYLAEGLEGAGLKRVHSGEFFHEFLTSCPIPADELTRRLEAKGILGGYPTDEGILWCATEMNTKQEMDELISLVKEACR